MADQIDETDKTIVNMNDSAYGPIPKTWAELTNLTPGEDATVYLVNTKHGLGILIANKNNQPQLEELGNGNQL